MRYLGGKHLHGNKIMTVMLKHRPGTTRFIDLFCGGLSMTAYSPHTVRVANDVNPALITLYRKWQYGWRPSVGTVTKDEWVRIKEINDPDDPMTALVGFGCSWGGKWGSGFAKNDRRWAGPGDAFGTACRSIDRKMSGPPIDFRCGSYTDVELRPGDLVYCDPPYRGTTEYKGVAPFDFDVFLDWCENQGGVFVSEYEFGIGSEIWRSPPDKKGMHKGAIDRLFYVD